MRRDGRRVQVDGPLRVAGRVVDGATRGRRFSMAEDEFPPRTLWPIPAVLTLTNGREYVVGEAAREEGRVRFLERSTGRRLRLPEEQIAAPALGSLAVVLRLRSGRDYVVGDLALSEGRLRFEEVTTGQRLRLPQEDVASPALDQIPLLLVLRNGREYRVTGLEREDGRVRFREAHSGALLRLPETDVASPPLAVIPLVGTPTAPAPPEPVPAPVPEPPRPVAPPKPPAPPAARPVADAKVFDDRWDVFEKLFAELSLDEDELRRLRIVPSGNDPYNQNTAKGDKPIAGADVFFVFTAALDSLSELRRIPLPSGVSAERPSSFEFFGDGDQAFTTPRGSISFELFKGQTAFRPKTWALKVTAAGNVNHLRGQERNAVNIDPRAGRTRTKSRLSLEEAFAEVKLADLSPHYDSVSLRAGIQPFVSDFRGFVFNDVNLGARLFGNLGSNRWQYNAAYFDLLEKETNSELNTFERREQRVFVANLFRQDFLSKGYTLQLSYHRSQDEARGKPHFDSNDFPVRPARIGTPRLHGLTTQYAGFAGEGHAGRLNLSHAAYYVSGEDEDHPLSGPQDVSAVLLALELSVDRDWARFRASGLLATGDDDPFDAKARGFDSIYDTTNFAGGPFSFWSRSGIPLTQTSVLLKSPGSLLPSLRSNKFEGQANHVNPGLLLANLGLDLELTPKLKAVVNASYHRFHKTGALEALLFQPRIRKSIGFDVGAGILWRPDLSENFVVTAGVTALLPGAGFDDLFSSPCSAAACGASSSKLYNAFVQLKLTY